MSDAGEDADSQYGMDEHEQQNEVTGVLSGKRPRTSYAKSRNAFVQKDFIWDQYVKYFATSLLALTVIDFALEYFSGGDAVCFPDALENDSWAREFASGVPLATYINRFCSMDIPRFQYFTVFVTALGIALTLPHFVWKGYFDAQFQSLFTVAKELNPLKEKRFCEGNIHRVKTVESKFGKQKSIYISYIVKLLLQLLVSISGICIAWAVFTEVSHTFTCPSSWSDDGYTEGWPLNTNVTCVYTSARFFSLFRGIITVFMTASIFCLLLGLGWCFGPHSDLECSSGFLSSYHALDWLVRKDVKKTMSKDQYSTSVGFAQLTYLPPELYKPPTTIFQRKLCRSPVCPFLFGLMIRNDLRFLILLLYQSDAIVGDVFNTVLLRIHLFYLTQRRLIYERTQEAQEIAKKEEEKSASLNDQDSKGLSVSCTLVEVMKAMEKWKDPFPKKFIVLTVVWGIYDCAIAIEKWLKDAQEENWLEDVVVVRLQIDLFGLSEPDTKWDRKEERVKYCQIITKLKQSIPFEVCLEMSKFLKQDMKIELIVFGPTPQFTCEEKLANKLLKELIDRGLTTKRTQCIVMQPQSVGGKMIDFMEYRPPRHLYKYNKKESKKEMMTCAYIPCEFDFAIYDDIRKQTPSLVDVVIDGLESGDESKVEGPAPTSTGVKSLLK